MSGSPATPADPRWPRLFGLLAVAMLLKGLVWTYAIPPFDAPDEPAHYSHTQLLALRGNFPTYGTLDRVSPDAALLTHAILVPLPPGNPAARLYQERAAQGSGPTGPAEGAVSSAAQDPPSRTPTASYGPVSYVLYAVPVRLLAGEGIVAQLEGARIVAVLLGVLAVVAVGWAGLEAGLDHRLAGAAAVIAGYQPMWSQQTAAVTADAALFLGSSAFLALMLRWLRRPSPRVGLAAAAVLSLTLLAKPAGLFALPFAALFLVPVVTGRGRGRLPALGLAVGLLALAVVPYLAWSRLRPGDPGVYPDHGTVAQYAAMVRADGFAYVRGVIAGFWGNFGWLEQSLSPGLITGLRYASATAFAVCVTAVVLRPRASRPVVLGLAYFLACAGVAFGFDLFLWLSQHTLGIQGRYLLPALGGAAVALVAAVDAMLPRRWAWLVAAGLAGAMVVLNMVSVGLLAQRYFVG